MLTIFKKEIISFFSSLTGYLVIIVFLLLNSLFIWIFRGGLNIIESSFAGLDALFLLAPWLFLFLVPAVTMRMFSEEKKSGTLDLMFTRPVSEMEIVLAKFFASWALIALALMPTLVFFGSVFLLGSPPGNMDTGGTWGSYIGLLFLGGIYAGIGVFSSSLTENQIVAFIISVLLCFLFFMGFSFISTLGNSGELMNMIEKIGIDYHYQSISRGVIDSRDIIYFTSLVVLFVYLTTTVLQSRRWRK